MQGLSLGRGQGYCLQFGCLIEQPHRTTCKYQHRKDLPIHLVQAGKAEHAAELADTDGPVDLVTKEQLEWAKRNIKNLKTVYLGFGLHFLHESSPHRIGREIAKWMSALPPATRTS